MSTCAAGVDEPHGDSTRSPPEAEALGQALAAPGRLARLRRRVIGLHLLARRMILAPAFSPAPANPTAACGRSSSPSASHAGSAALSAASASAASTPSTAVQVKADWEPFFSGPAPLPKKIALPDNGPKANIQAPAPPRPGQAGVAERGCGAPSRHACTASGRHWQGDGRTCCLQPRQTGGARNGQLAGEGMTRTARANDQWQRDSAQTRQPDWLEPELATLTADRFSDPAWIFERKFDGERCLAFRAGQQLRLMTRNRQQVTSTYPEIADALRGQEACDFIVDGEVVAFDGDQTSFSRLQRRLGGRDPGPALRAEVSVYLYCFDVLWAGGRDGRPVPLRGPTQLL